MTKKETSAIMAVIRATYPQYYKGYTDAEAVAVINLWADIFAEDDPAAVAAAVKTFIATDVKGFPPMPGAIRDIIYRNSIADTLTPLEAWGMVSKALRNSAYNSKEEFDRLPEVIQAAIGCPENLHQWASIESDDAETVIQSNFLRSFNVAQTRLREKAMLPLEARNLFGAIAEQKRVQTALEVKSSTTEPTLQLVNTGQSIPMPDDVAEEMRKRGLAR